MAIQVTESSLDRRASLSPLQSCPRAARRTAPRAFKVSPGVSTAVPACLYEYSLKEAALALEAPGQDAAGAPPPSESRASEAPRVQRRHSLPRERARHNLPGSPRPPFGILQLYSSAFRGLRPGQACEAAARRVMSALHVAPDSASRRAGSSMQGLGHHYGSPA